MKTPTSTFSLQNSKFASTKLNLDFELIRYSEAADKAIDAALDVANKNHIMSDGEGTISGETLTMRLENLNLLFF